MLIPITDFFFVFDTWTIALDIRNGFEEMTFVDGVTLFDADQKPLGTVSVLSSLPTQKADVHSLSLKDVDEELLKLAKFAEPISS